MPIWIVRGRVGTLTSTSIGPFPARSARELGKVEVQMPTCIMG